MMKKETDVLGDVVMNALWFPTKYMRCKNQPEEEQSAGQLAREYVVPVVPSISHLIV